LTTNQTSITIELRNKKINNKQNGVNNMETLTIGRRTVNTSQFTQAVQNSHSAVEVCKAIGFNETVCTTVNMIKECIQALQLDTTHFKTPLNRERTDKFNAYQEQRIKSFKLNDNNRAYYEAFEKSISDKSWATYKSSIGNFLESLGDVDFAKTMNTNKIDSYTQGKTNAESHIRSLLIFIVANDINGAKAKVYKDMLIWCISNRAKKTN
jgi:hypothetical protein